MVPRRPEPYGRSVTPIQLEELLGDARDRDRQLGSIVRGSLFDANVRECDQQRVLVGRIRQALGQDQLQVLEEANLGCGGVYAVSQRDANRFSPASNKRPCRGVPSGPRPADPPDRPDSAGIRCTCRCCTVWPAAGPSLMPMLQPAGPIRGPGFPHQKEKVQRVGAFVVRDVEERRDVSLRHDQRVARGNGKASRTRSRARW